MRRHSSETPKGAYVEERGTTSVIPFQTESHNGLLSMGMGATRFPVAPLNRYRSISCYAAFYLMVIAVSCPLQSLVII